MIKHTVITGSEPWSNTQTIKFQKDTRFPKYNKTFTSAENSTSI